MTFWTSVVGLTWLFCAGYASAEPEAIPQATIEALLAAHAPAENSEFLQAPGDLYFDLQRIEATSRVTYLGRHRPIPDERRRFLEAYFERSLKRPEWSALYKEEILCSQGSTAYWLPIQNALLGYLLEEIKAPGEIVVDIRLLGAYRAQNQELVNVFIIAEFAEPG